MEPADTVDVVQTVIRDSREKYLIGKRTRDGYWEFLGGKLEESETVREAAFRELQEETGIETAKEDLANYVEGKTYRSRDSEVYRLNPVLLEFSDTPEVEELSEEHSEVEWIDLEEFHSYETLGQYQALENLGVVEGEVALPVPRKEGKYLILKRSEETSSSGLWNFPGGKKEEKESLQETAVRELREETGMQGEIIEEGEAYINNGELGYWYITPYLVEVSGDIELNHEHSDYRWIKPENLEELETLGTDKALESLKRVEL